MLWLSFALGYLALTALCLAMNRHHKALLGGEPSPTRRRGLRLGAAVAMLLALILCIAAQGGEIGAVIWLCQLMVSGWLLVGLLAWRQRWALSMAALLPLGSGLFALLG
ncbi:DUF3325 domain-containing protein [Pseudomonas indica]|uniref:DUF3325 domain-containing protein n=1 Tax=Pseudomonas indica TaxID=137658 RepID=UPI000BABE6BB|nr:DUF3325 domain-containing protein [Pseudomonas indica]PAU60863.1 hypothetical protein BZL42_09835 [Pseudomonas indica]